MSLKVKKIQNIRSLKHYKLQHCHYPCYLLLQITSSYRCCLHLDAFKFKLSSCAHSNHFSAAPGVKTKDWKRAGNVLKTNWYLNWIYLILKRSFSDLKNHFQSLLIIASPAQWWLRKLEVRVKLNIIACCALESCFTFNTIDLNIEITIILKLNF